MMFSQTTRSFTKIGTVGLVALLTLGGCGSASSSDDSGKGGDVTISFVWWGNDARASMYEEAIDLFEADNPGIIVTTGFADYPSFWQARAVEAASGSLPDVIQFDINYLAEYGERGQLLDLSTSSGDALDLAAIAPTLLPAGQIGGGQVAVPVSTNTMSLISNPAILAAAGVTLPEDDLTWAQYQEVITDVAASDPGAVWGASDYTSKIQYFELWLRQQGGALFTDEGKLAFTQDELAEFWETTAQLRSDDAVIPQSTLTQIAPKSGLGANMSASEVGLDNFLAQALADSGAEAFTIQAPPSDDPDNLGIYLKPSMMLSASKNTEHPEESARLISFLVNDARVGKIFGASRGLPASSTQRAGADLTGVDAQVAAYEESVKDRLGDAPRPPITGFGTLETTYIRLSENIGYDLITPEQAAAEFFVEAELVVNGA